MSWLKKLFPKKEKTPNTKKVPQVEPQQEKQYTYRVKSLSSTQPWIFIACNEEDATENAEPFTDLVKKAAGILNDGAWEGHILPAGNFLGDSRYRIKNDPLFMVFQYDTLFGIVLEYSPGLGLDTALNYLRNMLGVAVDDQFFQPAPVKKPAPSVQKEAPLPKWQHIYNGAKSLHVFKKANESIMQGGAYQKILELMSEQYYQSLRSNDKGPKWEETASMLRVSGEWSHWVGHDDTLRETIDIKFERLTHWDEPAAWDAEHDLPCEKMSLVLDKPISEGDNWSYFRQTHKAWLIQAPFGLPGVWRLEYKSTDSR